MRGSVLPETPAADGAVEPIDSDRLLRPGETCWQVAQAKRYAPIIDGADYLRHVKSAMLRARHRIIVVGWDLDSRMPFEANDPVLPGPNHLMTFLHALLWHRPHLQVYLLKSNLRLLRTFDPYWIGPIPTSWLNRVTSSRLHFAVDGAHPLGAVHHQKVVVVDDVVAFCGGIDLTLGRWDTRGHEPDAPGRRAAGQPYGPRHEVATVVDGPAARVLAELARDRWRTATGQALPALAARTSAWPRRCRPALRDVEVGVARTSPTLPGRDEVREIEALNLAAIASARRVIYLENQYLAARGLAEALAARLREPDGPEVIVVLPRSSESRLEQESMDSARERLVRLLWTADEHGRLGIYWPVVRGAVPVYVHSKVMIVDDHFLRIGSSNLNNRSMGFDSECDLGLEAAGAEQDHIRRHIEHMRDDLLAEHLGVTVAALRAEAQARQSVVAAVDALRGTGRSLRRFTDAMVSAEAGPFAESDLMDPAHVPVSLAATVCTTTLAAATWPLTRAAPQLWSTLRAVTEQVRAVVGDLAGMGSSTLD